MHTLAYSEDPDEMPHNAAFHQGLHWLLRQAIFRKRNTILFENYYLWPLDIYSGQAQVYCIKPKEEFTSILKRLSLQLWTFFDYFFYYFFKSFVKVELSYVFTINLFTMAENCTEKWIIL